ncbi:MAG: hypothetical protein P8H17_07025, partial [Flavobacteriales bacterium]|nr:hypothetical protein [Flavobacteriales bacterium]
KIFIVLIFLSSCANIVAPTGGVKDSESPKLLSSTSEINENSSEKNVIFEFDERIQEHLFVENFYFSPPLKEVSYKVSGKEIYITIADTLSNDLKYIIILNNCIKDITEGNVLEELEYIIPPKDTTLNFYYLNVKIENSLTKEDEKNHWVLLYNSDVPDSLIFKITPNYVSKTNKSGFANFNNLIKGSYKITSLSGDDYIYHEDDIISFSDQLIRAGTDTTIDLFTFDPIYKIDSIEIIKDTTITTGGSLTLKSDFSGNTIVQLLKGSKVYIQEKFESNTDFTLKNIPTGEYTLRAWGDKNGNTLWDSGSWIEKRQTEKMRYYSEKITVRENWNLELEWFIEE